MIADSELLAALSGMTVLIDADSAATVGDGLIAGALADPPRFAEGLISLIGRAQRNNAPPAVVVAMPTAEGGLVLRWYRHELDAGEGRNFAMITATRSGVMVDGKTPLHGIPAAWLADAERGHQLLSGNLQDEARAMATHEHGKVFGGDVRAVTR